MDCYAADQLNCNLCILTSMIKHTTSTSLESYIAMNAHIEYQTQKISII